ncbi:MAG TPA: response regulator [Reyranella sp.]|jgi:DNA-binding NtrC family response regulator|nr:response regulator [Reyranella sp.]
MMSASPATTGSGNAPDGGITARILIVEDDVLIRAAAAQYLRGAGFEVLEAVSVEQALELLRAGPVKAVFADVKLPGTQSGLDLMRIVQADFPKAKVLLTSGVVKADEVTTEGITLLRKPYFLFEVERHLRALIAG